MKQDNPFMTYLNHHDVMILDGALATELQRHGCDLNDSLWSAKILSENPNLIKQIHYEYFIAGASCTITASYQATPQGFAQKGIDELESIELIKRSVELALAAKKDYQSKFDTKKQLFIAGSVGPYGAFLADGSEYTGAYHLQEKDLVKFHEVRIKTLIEAGADVIAFETMPSFHEIKVLALMMKKYPNMPCWFSFTLKDEHHLSDGTPLNIVTQFLNDFEQVVAIGINCIALDKVTSALATLHDQTNKPLIVYPNSGEVYDATTKEWHKDKHAHHDLVNLAKSWPALGAKIIGGCCRTTPADIERLAQFFASK